jgi:pilus assembly protein Flp/PilA
MSKFASFLKDESGASAAEYVLILAIIGTAIAAATTVFGTAIGGALNKAANAINAYSYTAPAAS